MGILIIPIFLILMYVALLRPQQQRVRRQQQLVSSIGIGDEVVTAGGLIGRVVGLTDDRLQLEVTDGVVIELLRMAISRRFEPGDGDREVVDTGDGETEEWDAATDDVPPVHEPVHEPVHDQAQPAPADQPAPLPLPPLPPLPPLSLPPDPDSR